MTPTVSFFIAVVPWDHTLAHVEIFGTRLEAEEFIKTEDTREEGKGFIIENKVKLTLESGPIYKIDVKPIKKTYV